MGREITKLYHFRLELYLLYVARMVQRFLNSCVSGQLGVNLATRLWART